MKQRPGMKLHEWQQQELTRKDVERLWSQSERILRRNATKAMRFGLDYGASGTKLRTMFERGIAVGAEVLKVDYALVEMWAAAVADGKKAAQEKVDTDE